MGMYKDIEGALGPDEFNYAYSISLRHHYMFVENAKSASTTLKTILGGLELSDTGLGVDIVNNYFNDVHPNVLGSPFLKPFQLGEAAFDKLVTERDVFCMTFVRNPYSRLLSAYLDKIVPEPRKLESVSIFDEAARLNLHSKSGDLSFFAFLLCVRALLLRGGHVDCHWRPQHVQTQIETVEYDLIGRVETIRSDLAKVETALRCKLTYPGKVGGHETGADVRLAEKYIGECPGLIEEIYEKDFKCFGYPIGLRHYIGSQSWC